MNASVRHVLGMAAIAVGVVFLVFAYNGSKAPVDQIASALTGSYTEQTMWFLLMGVVSMVVGATLMMLGRRSF